MKWYLVVLIVYLSVCLLLGIVSLFVKPLRPVFRGFLYAVWFLLEILWIVLVWWWLSIVRIIRKRPLPRFVLLRRKE